MFNESGTAQNLFNTDGNIALDRSILNDEASIYSLVLQFEEFLNDLIKCNHKLTIFNVLVGRINSVGSIKLNHKKY